MMVKKVKSATDFIPVKQSNRSILALPLMDACRVIPSVKINLPVPNCVERGTARVTINKDPGQGSIPDHSNWKREVNDFLKV